MQPIDLSDDLSFTAGFPHEYFTWLRKNSPVYWHEPTHVTPDKEGFWVVCCYKDVNYVLRNPTIFSSDKAGERVGGGTGIKDEKTAGKLLNQSDVALFFRAKCPTEALLLTLKYFTSWSALNGSYSWSQYSRSQARCDFTDLCLWDRENNSEANLLCSRYRGIDKNRNVV